VGKKNCEKKIVVAGHVLFGKMGVAGIKQLPLWDTQFLKQNYVQQIIIWTRRRRESRDATLYSWKVDRRARGLQLFDQLTRFQASTCALSLTGLFAVAAAAHARNSWLDLVLFF